MIKCCMNEQAFNGISANADAFSSTAGQGLYGKWFPAEEFTGMSVQATLAGADHADGVVKVQTCDYPTPSDAHAIDLAGATVTLTSNADFGFSVDMTKLTQRWARLAYVHGSNTMGTVTAYVTMKG